MKSIFAALIVLASASAFAMPAVGDKASFKGQYTYSGGVMDITATNEITAFDPAAGVYTVLTTSLFGSEKQVEEQKIKAQDLATDGMIADILKNCAQYGGQAEKVTVAAGTFDSCILKNASKGGTSSTWIAAVPFGAVKIVNTNNGEILNAELTSFEFGK